MPNIKADKSLLQPKTEEDIIKSVDDLGDIDPQLFLAKSIKYNFLKGTKLALENVANFYKHDNHYIKSACTNGHTEIVKLFLGYGFDVQYENNLALRWAVLRKGNIDTIKLLLDHGADPNVEWGYPITKAAELGSIEMMELLIDYGADISVRNEMPLIAACYFGNEEAVKFLIKNGADINAQQGRPLKSAILLEREKIVELLLEYNVDVYNIKHFNLAIREGNKKIIKLLKNYLNVNESIRKFLKPKSEDHILKDMDDMDPNELLIKCSEKGFDKGIKLALERGADVHAADDFALRWASRNGHAEVVKLLLDHGADVHVENNMPLMWASENGHTEIVKLLLDHGADVHAKDDGALTWASFNGHTEVVKLLLDSGADVHVENNMPLMWASENGHTGVVKLLKKHMKVNESVRKFLKPKSEEEILKDMYNVEPKELLVKSIEKNFLEGVKFALENKDKIDIYDVPLNRVAELGHTEILKLLLEKFNFKQEDIDNALSQASEYGHLDSVKVLIEAGGDISFSDYSPIIWATFSGNIHIVEFLLKYDISQEALNTSLLYASRINYVDLIELLLDHGANIHFDENKPLEKASHDGNIEAVKLLLDYGANVHALNDIALRRASKAGNTEVVKLLLDHGANVHADDNYALRFACKFGHTEVVKLLLDHGANVHINNNQALRWAKHSGIVELLKKHMGINESIRKFLKPKTQEEITKKMEETDPNELLIKSSKVGITKGVKLALEKGAKVQYGNNISLRNACIGGHIDIVKILLDNGADVHVNNGSPLKWSAIKLNPELFKLLLDYGADPNVIGTDLIKHLETAIRKQKEANEILELLNKYK